MITDETKEKLNTLKATLDPFRVLQLINYEKSSPIDTGDEIRDYCPIHKGDKQLSLTINKDKKTFFCHSCGEKGDLIYLYQKSTERNFKDSCQDLNLPDSAHCFPAQKTTVSNEKRTPQQVINESKPLVSHPYLTAKRVDPCDGLLQGKDDRRNDSIVVPLKNISGELQAVQFVHENGKFFNGPSKGAFFIIGSLETSPKVWLAEGIATALTIWRAYNKEITVISFGSIINLPTVVSRIKTKYPETELIICLDYGTAAFKKAHKLDQEYPNLKYCTPSFEGLSYQEEKKPTDFNDLISQCNLKDLDVQKQLEKTITIHEVPTDLEQKESHQEVKTKPAKVTTISNEKPILSIKNLLEKQEKKRGVYFGKDMIGFPQKTLPTLDSLLLGLRGTILFAADSNTGKTALTIQLALDILLNNDDICLVFVSLEMSAMIISERMRINLAKMTYRNFLFGRKHPDGEHYYSDEDLKKLDESKKTLEQLNDRIAILDEESCQEINLKTIQDHADRLKEKSNCKNVIFVIDYLQVFPVDEKIARRSELEQDRWRIKEMKKLRDANNNNPVLVIAETRKSSNSNPKATKKTIENADVSGSVRAWYTADAICLFDPLTNKELIAGFNEHVKVEDRIPGDGDKANVNDLFASKGISVFRLIVSKGRDGMQKGNCLVKFNFWENRFEEFKWEREWAFIAEKINPTPPSGQKKPVVENQSAFSDVEKALDE